MPKLNERKYDCLANQTGLSGRSLNEMEWEWLSSLTGKTVGKLNELWMAQLDAAGYSSGNFNERSEAMLDDLGLVGTLGEKWWQYWDQCIGFGPTAIISPPAVMGTCDISPPDITCTASTTFTATAAGFTNPGAATYKWSIIGTVPVSAIINGPTNLATAEVRTTFGAGDHSYQLKLVITEGAETAERTIEYTHVHEHHADVLMVNGLPLQVAGDALTV